MEAAHVCYLSALLLHQYSHSVVGDGEAQSEGKSWDVVGVAAGIVYQRWAARLAAGGLRAPGR